MKKKFCIYEAVTKQIIDKLEQGCIPWRKPWTTTSVYPCNLISDKQYSGLNFILLSMRDFNSSYWATAAQINKVGGKIKKGEKATMIIFWKLLEKKREGKEEEKIPLLRYYNVFNVEQCENIDMEKVKEEREKIKEQNNLDFKPILSAEEIINNFKDAPAIVYTGNSASYTKSSDVIRMPEKSSFINEEEFYSTLFHELGHSTGHEKRLDRDSLTAFSAFGDVIYSKEELVAEFCSSFLCHKSGISNVTLDNSASYIQGWSKFLRDNPTALVQASSQAKKASEYILNNRQVRE